MEPPSPLLFPLSLLAAGFLAGLAAGLLWQGGRRRLAAELLGRAERQRQAETEALLDGVKLAFADIAIDQVRKLADQLASGLERRLAAERRVDEQRLLAERGELDARLKGVSGQLERLMGVVRELERDREAKLAQVTAELGRAGERVETLAQQTDRLARVLGQARLRGQWGERAAEDLLRAVGLLEGASWVRQSPLRGGGRPDVTFLLPDGATLHLDVKFPLDNWLAAQAAEGEAERRRLEAAFLADVRAAIGELARRAYAEPASAALDLVLLFVPSEAVAQALWNLAPGLLDEAMERRVLLVSPASLLAVLVVIRRALEAFRLEGGLRALAAEARGLDAARAELAGELERLGRRLEEAVKAFRAVQAVRQDRLDRHLDRLLAGDGPAPRQAAAGSASPTAAEAPASPRDAAPATEQGAGRRPRDDLSFIDDDR